MLIYKATNKINGKIYIGQTHKSLEERKMCHKHDSKNIDTYFYRAIRKYGWDNFSWEIVEDNIPTEEELNNKEKYYIQKYDCFDNKEKGYNTTSGGERNYSLTIEECKKRSLRAQGVNNPMYNKPGTWLGKHFSETHKKNLSKSLKGKPHYGQQKDKHYNAKQVINLSTGEIFGSIISASEKYNVCRDALSNCLNKKTNTCCGCKWDFLENIDQSTFSPLEKNNKDFKPSYQKKNIYIQELDTIYNTLKEAANVLGCSPSLISIKCSKLPNNQFAIIKNYHVKYV